MKALHLNLLNPAERRSAAPVRAHVMLPVCAGLVTAFVLLWGGFVGIQLALVNVRIARTHAVLDAQAAQIAECDALKARLAVLQAEADQFAAYVHGRRTRGELLKQLAFAVPDGITLTSLALPPPPEQGLTPPPGSRLPALQGPTQTVERAELRLTGLARGEQEVFRLMRELEGPSFTGLVSIVKHPTGTAEESPRVLAFRQEAPQTPSGRRDVFFDIVYDLAPREFVK